MEAYDVIIKLAQEALESHITEVEVGGKVVNPQNEPFVEVVESNKLIVHSKVGPVEFRGRLILIPEEAYKSLLSKA